MSNTLIYRHVIAQYWTRERAVLPTFFFFLLPVKIVGPGKNFHVFIWEYAYCHEYRIFPVTAACKLDLDNDIINGVIDYF